MWPTTDWLCTCTFPDGSTETTIWLTQDGANQMAAETVAEFQRRRKRVTCVIEEVDPLPPKTRRG